MHVSSTSIKQRTGCDNTQANRQERDVTFSRSKISHRRGQIFEHFHYVETKNFPAVSSNSFL